MAPIFSRSALLFASLAVSPFSLSEAQEVPDALCESGECQPAISAVEYRGRKAFKLTDGKTEAIIVPEIGRIMSFGKVGGPNLLWNLSGPALPKPAYTNYGGDKTWLAPQSSWNEFHGKNNWPPDRALDGDAHRVEVLTGGKVRLISPLSMTGIRLTRTIYFAGNGEFVIEQTARKEKGTPVRASIWSITQTVPGQAVFLPLDPQSSYARGHFRYVSQSEAQTTAVVKPNLLRLVPSGDGGGVKFGVDAQVSSIVSVRDGVAFLQKSTKPAGVYPDGQGGAGFPVELFVNGDAKNFYCEMELLGPLRNFSIGGKSTHTVRWSLHSLPSQNVDSPAVIDVVEKLLFAQ